MGIKHQKGYIVVVRKTPWRLFACVFNTFAFFFSDSSLHQQSYARSLDDMSNQSSPRIRQRTSRLLGLGNHLFPCILPVPSPGD